MISLAAISPLWGISAALIPAAAALIGQALVRLKESRDRRRSEYGHAFAAALGWAELPYRVARRLSNDAESCRPLVEAFHQAHQEILYHRGWLQSVSPEIGRAYDQLVAAVKTQTAPYLVAAWKSDPLPVETMSIGAIYEIDIGTEQAAFIAAVRRDLSLTERLVGTERLAGTSDHGVATPYRARFRRLYLAGNVARTLLAAVGTAIGLLAEGAYLWLALLVAVALGIPSAVAVWTMPPDRRLRWIAATVVAAGSLFAVALLGGLVAAVFAFAAFAVAVFGRDVLVDDPKRDEGGDARDGVDEETDREREPDIERPGEYTDHRKNP